MKYEGSIKMIINSIVSACAAYSLSSSGNEKCEERSVLRSQSNIEDSHVDLKISSNKVMRCVAFSDFY